MAQFNRTHTTFYYLVVVCLSRMVSKIFNVEWRPVEIWVKGHGHWKYSTDEFDSHHVCAWEFLCVLRISLNYGHLARVILRYSSVFSRLNSLVFTCRVRRGQPVTVPPKINHFVIRRACWHLSYRWLVGVERHFQASEQKLFSECTASVQLWTIRNKEIRQLSVW